MTSNANCLTCLRLLRKQLRYSPHLHRSARSFSLSPSVPSPKPSAEKDAIAPFSRNIAAGNSFLRLAAQKIREKAPVTTETYIAYAACEVLVKECARQADYKMPQVKPNDRSEIPQSKYGEDLGVGEGWWYEVLGLRPTFNTWAQVTFLHMYFLTVRIRTLPPTTAPVWHQHLLDHFFYMAEDRMVQLHAMNARSVRNKYLKDLFQQWRGLQAGYDEGLGTGEDAVLATALWRNIFNADEDVDLRLLGAVVSYTRGVLAGLEQMEDDALATGEVVFGNPSSQLKEVLVQSRTMMAPMREEVQSGTHAAEAKAGEDKTRVNGSSSNLGRNG